MLAIALGFSLGTREVGAWQSLGLDQLPWLAQLARVGGDDDGGLFHFTPHSFSAAAMMLSFDGMVAA